MVEDGRVDHATLRRDAPKQRQSGRAPDLPREFVPLVNRLVEPIELRQVHFFIDRRPCSDGNIPERAIVLDELDVLPRSLDTLLDSMQQLPYLPPVLFSVRGGGMLCCDLFDMKGFSGLGSVSSSVTGGVSLIAEPCYTLTAASLV